MSYNTIKASPTHSIPMKILEVWGYPEKTINEIVEEYKEQLDNFKIKRES